ELSLFEACAEALRGLVSSDLGAVRLRWHRYGIKVWFGPERPPREHYEAQVIGPEHVESATVLGLEVGFHAEHRDAADNDRVIARLLDSEGEWRPKIGAEAVVGPFLGRAASWRRVSEIWADPDLSSTDLAFEVASRIGEYASALEPLRRREARPASRRRAPLSGRPPGPAVSSGRPPGPAVSSGRPPGPAPAPAREGPRRLPEAGRPR